MKKLISCLLAVLLVCSLMSMSVFAAPVLDGSTPNNAVGTHGKNDNINDGADDLSNVGNNTADVTVKFEDNGDPNSGITNKYAVDIVYYELIVDLNELGNDTIDQHFIWNVNTHKYDLDAETSDATKNTVPLEQEAFQITNHSDRGVGYSAVVADAANTGLELNLILATTTNKTVEENLVAVLSGATNGTIGTLVKLQSAPATGTNWTDAVNTLSANAYIAGETIGTITITFAPGTDK